MTDEVMVILDSYIKFARPLLNPQTGYLLSSTTGTQHQSLTTAMTMLVYEAIGRYINPTRYRQLLRQSVLKCFQGKNKNASLRLKSIVQLWQRSITRKSDLVKWYSRENNCMDKMIASSQNDDMNTKRRQFDFRD